MIRPIFAAALMVAAVIPIAAPALAATRIFTGTQMNDTPPPMPSPLCAPGQLRIAFTPETAISTGSSNFGTFASSQAHCLTPPPTVYDNGMWDYAFEAGDRLVGTYSGFFTPTGVPNVLDNTIELTVTGGTGRFLGATGVIHGVGPLDRRLARPVSTLTLNGVLNLPAVPEPTSWAMLIAGFGLVGRALRQRRGAVAA